MTHRRRYISRPQDEASAVDPDEVQAPSAENLELLLKTFTGVGKSTSQDGSMLMSSYRVQSTEYILPRSAFPLLATAQYSYEYNIAGAGAGVISCSCFMLHACGLLYVPSTLTVCG